MTMDVRTLFFAVSVGCVMGGFAMAVVWLANRRVPGIGFWGASTFSMAVGFPLFALQGVVAQRWLTHVLPNALFLVMVASFYAGACRFTGRRLHGRALWVGSAGVLLGFLFFLYGYDSLLWRVRLSSVWSGIFYLLTAWVLAGERRQGLRLSTGLTSAAFAGGAGLMGYRLAVTHEGPPGGWISGNAWQNAVLALAALAVTFLWIFCVLFLVNQYQARELALRMEAQRLTEEELTAARHEIELQRTRQRVARELHDGIAGITATVALLAGMGRSEEGEARAGLLGHIEEMALEGNREIKQLIGSVERGARSWQDWLLDLENYARKVTATAAIALDWRVIGVPPGGIIAEAEAAESLMKVAMEALHNLARHSGAGHGRVVVGFEDNALELEIHDDGRGFVKERDGGRGISNMRKRMEEMGGSFSIRGGGGTTLKARIDKFRL